ncbi:conserved hypothetical protein [Carnobacterium maltaromaticum]|uniref:hypothetical protein n=1 Tax=Carnobacterium maltaromaticum TaxID=2751 RepID=UPI00191BB6B0|nr:hypothetical protein [Carnobacterium maltaromaticum]CAD5896354.1 conserved hypothetical protein [Carnobacterium maltaromaticum]
MTIEDYWEDRQVYHITFSNTEDRVFHRCIILPIDFGNKEKIRNLITTKFAHIKEVIDIDEFEEALELKV